MKTKFTPGPWQITFSGSKDLASILDLNENLVISGEYDGYMCPFVCKEIEEATANVYLVSTAPELYNLLQEAVDEEEAFNRGERVYAKWLEKAKQVLAKARGEEI